MRIRLLLILAAALMAMPATAQTAAFTTAGPMRMGAALGALPLDLVPSAPASAGVAVDGIAARRRPWWAIPAAGAGIGLLAGLLVDDDCRQKDATVCFPAPLLGVVYGTAGGLAIEALF
jgi:hypothetical protein